ncbi:MAG: GTPase ObgE [Patescibacteria group bacterium]
MFIDEAEIYLKAGNGGDGAVSFRREKYIPHGGPDGGDGGNGGDIIIEVDENSHALAEFNYKKRFLAENGRNGMGSNKAGKAGQDLVIKMPPGTQIYKKNELVADLVKKGEQFLFLKGGRGGWGNQHFASSIKQAPAWSKKGEKGESIKIRLELKTIADIGLVGMPNAGKSTLLSVLSDAKPRIADYPFTTLEPNLGVLKGVKSRNIIIADIPGLIEGASHGKGLGDKFLRHIERTKAIVHILSAFSEDIIKDYKVIRKELKDFSPKLARKKEIVVLNKSDLLNDKELNQKIVELSALGVKPLMISAATHLGLEDLTAAIFKSL